MGHGLEELPEAGFAEDRLLVVLLAENERIAPVDIAVNLDDGEAWLGIHVRQLRPTPVRVHRRGGGEALLNQTVVVGGQDGGAANVL